jgi:hypothetical protein
MKEELSWLLLTVALSIALTNSFNSCQSFKPFIPPVKTEAVIEKLAPPIPEMPLLERVTFVSVDDYLCLSYDEYRALERNVIGLREYIEKLEAVLQFYRGKTE